MPSITPAARATLIEHLVSQQTIGSQEELREALAERGLEVTQATVSRDLKRLGLVRVATDDGYRYMSTSSTGTTAFVRPREVLAITHNETTVVVQTLAGRAQGVAATLDDLKLPFVLGTVAGDDTFIVIPTQVRKTATLARRLRLELGLTQEMS